MGDPLVIAGKTFESRLLLGTGKWTSTEVMVQALRASGTEMVTVAVRRVDLQDRSGESILGALVKEGYDILPNTAGCYNCEEAVRYARLGREAVGTDWVKLEVIGDQKTLMPDNIELLKATEILVKEGFIVLPYTTCDLVFARKLIEAGAACVMPLAAPIGSGMGVQDRSMLRLFKEAVSVPVIVDAGVGTASDAAVAMELGADGVLMNTGVACAQEPVRMAEAMKLAVEAGYLAARSGRIPAKAYASASSPAEGMLSPAGT